MLLKKLYDIEDRIIMRYLNEQQDKIYKRNKEDINPDVYLTPGTELITATKKKKK